MNTREAIQTNNSPALNKRRVNLFRSQEGFDTASYTIAGDLLQNKSGREATRKIIEARRRLG